jgi:hypothetical protein
MIIDNTEDLMKKLSKLNEQNIELRTQLEKTKDYAKYVFL